MLAYVLLGVAALLGLALLIERRASRKANKLWLEAQRDRDQWRWGV